MNTLLPEIECISVGEDAKSITTNGTNQIDVFLAYSAGGYCFGGYADKIFIRHIDP